MKPNEPPASRDPGMVTLMPEAPHTDPHAGLHVGHRQRVDAAGVALALDDQAAVHLGVGDLRASGPPSRTLVSRLVVE